MTFISMNYYLLVLAVLIVYYLLPIKHRWIALLVGNLSFYFLFYKTGWWIFGMTIAISYVAGIALHHFKGRARKLTLILSILVTVTPWFLTKNFNFILEVAKKDPSHW